MKILLTGSGGYLGSLAGPVLISKGHEVVGLDTCFYSDGVLFRDSGTVPKTIVKDLRDIEISDLAGMDAVVHMAEISNDPAGELVPEVTYDINHKGSVRLAEMARLADVKRFIYMSSCSVYGVSDEEFVDEESSTNPQSAYADCKLLVERDLSAMASDHFIPTFLRNATAYGASPHMRFDIVLNNLSGLAWTTKEIKMESDGTPWRPIVHGLDIARAIACVLDAPVEVTGNQVFNVGDTRHNYQVRDIAEVVGTVFPDCKVYFGSPGQDNRSYRVRFEKIHEFFPNFHCKWDLRKGAEQLLRLFQRIDMLKELFEHRSFTRVQQLKHLLDTGQINRKFFWTE